jgi:hypothetical protein
MSIRTLQQLLTAHCREFFKLRCGFDIQKYTQRALFVDDPETLDPMDESALLKALWNLSRADIPEDKWYSLVNRCRLLPVNDTVVFNTSKAIILELRQKFSEHIPSLLASCRAELACGTALCGELGVPEGFESSKERTVIHFSKFAHEKLLSFYLEQLLLAVHFGMPVAGTVVFSKESPPSNVFKFWTVPDIQRLDELVSIALRAYTEPRPLPIFNSASFAEARNSNGYKMIRDAISSCKATALFYNMDNIPQEEFTELANQIFFPIANMNGDA